MHSLHRLATEGSFAEVRRALAEPGARPSQPDMSGRTPLAVAAWARNSGALRALLADPRVAVSAPDHAGFTPLRRAVQRGDRAATVALVAAGALAGDREMLDALDQQAWGTAAALRFGGARLRPRVWHETSARSRVAGLVHAAQAAARAHRARLVGALRCRAGLAAPGLAESVADLAFSPVEALLWARALPARASAWVARPPPARCPRGPGALREAVLRPDAKGCLALLRAGCSPLEPDADDWTDLDAAAYGAQLSRRAYGCDAREAVLALLLLFCPVTPPLAACDPQLARLLPLLGRYRERAEALERAAGERREALAELLPASLAAETDALADHRTLPAAAELWRTLKAAGRGLGA